MNPFYTLALKNFEGRRFESGTDDLHFMNFLAILRWVWIRRGRGYYRLRFYWLVQVLNVPYAKGRAMSRQQLILVFAPLTIRIKRLERSSYSFLLLPLILRWESGGLFSFCRATTAGFVLLFCELSFIDLVVSGEEGALVWRRERLSRVIFIEWRLESMHALSVHVLSHQATPHTCCIKPLNCVFIPLWGS